VSLNILCVLRGGPVSLVVMPLSRMNTQLFLAIGIFALIVSVPSARAQKSSGGCSLLNSAQTAQYVTYDRMSGMPAGIRLRLHNNTDCNLRVETSDQEDRLINDGKLVDLNYLAANRRKQTIKSNGFGDSVGEYELLGGYSLTFVVPFSFFKQCRDVAVPFTYVWEKDHVGASFFGRVRHYVYFLAEDLPANLRNKRCP
jgi:hypothetical protein